MTERSTLGIDTVSVLFCVIISLDIAKLLCVLVVFSGDKYGSNELVTTLFGDLIRRLDHLFFHKPNEGAI